MRTINVSRRIPSAPEKVWAVLADFPNIATWNTGVAKSFATSDSTAGVGAQRHCDLAPFGELEETVKEWDDTRRMVISIDSAKKLPIAHGDVTLVLSSPVMKSLSDQSVSGATMMTSIAGLPSMFATMAIARAASN